jgi:hypothetical protein
MDFGIEPYEGVGPIRLGMTPVEIRKCVGGDYRSFWKTSASDVESDHFIGRGIVAHYNSRGVCEAVEFGGTEIPTFRGQALLRVSLGGLINWLKYDNHQAGWMSL